MNKPINEDLSRLSFAKFANQYLTYLATTIA